MGLGSGFAIGEATEVVDAVEEEEEEEAEEEVGVDGAEEGGGVVFGWGGEEGSAVDGPKVKSIAVAPEVTDAEEDDEEDDSEEVVDVMSLIIIIMYFWCYGWMDGRMDGLDGLDGWRVELEEICIGKRGRRENGEEDGREWEGRLPSR